VPELETAPKLKISSAECAVAATAEPELSDQDSAAPQE
jgi:hypothetical protein